jgi:hypothetical protein
MPQWEYCTLSYDENNVYYALYQANGIYSDTRPFHEHLWGSCLFALGSLRWEAMSVTAIPEGQLWHFKRPIQPGNDNFFFQ